MGDSTVRLLYRQILDLSESDCAEIAKYLNRSGPKISGISSEAKDFISEMPFIDDRDRAELRRIVDDLVTSTDLLAKLVPDLETFEKAQKLLGSQDSFDDEDLTLLSAVVNSFLKNGETFNSKDLNKVITDVDRDRIGIMKRPIDKLMKDGSLKNLNPNSSGHPKVVLTTDGLQKVQNLIIAFYDE